MVNVTWQSGMAFRAEGKSGKSFVMDAHPDYGGQGLGPSPVEALLASAAACSGMDVIMVLQKKRQAVESYRIEVDGVRGEPGIYPRPFQSITIRHIIKGQDLDLDAVAKAVELSDQKYCTVVTTLRAAPTVHSLWEIED